MLECVREFHKSGMAHRDIKPDNFRVKDGNVFLIDFGNAFAFSENG